MTGMDVVYAARKYLGARHEHHGRLPSVIDCAGLLILVAKDIGIMDPSFEFTSYAPLNDGSELERIIREYCDEVPYTAKRFELFVHGQPGDIVVMRPGPHPQHCGFLTDIGLIHSYDSVVEHSIDGPWPRFIKKVFRVRGIEEADYGVI